MADAGRNDPCPCGSGRKYKKCCLESDRAPLTLATDNAARHSAMSRLLEFAMRPQFSTDWAVAEVVFWSDRLNDRPEDDVDRITGSEDAEAKLNSFFLFDVNIDNGRRVVDMFLVQKGHTLSSAERAFVERMAASHPALYEITGVSPGEGVQLHDLFTGDRFFVAERAGSTQLVPWDLIAGRVVPDSAGMPRFEGGVYLYPTTGKETILRELKTHQRRFRKRAPSATVADFFRNHAAVFNWLWLDLVVLRTPPTIVTAEGEEIVFTSTLFDVTDGPALAHVLERVPDLERNEDASYTWLQRERDMARVLGTVTVEGERLRLETMSRARGERGRAWLESIAGAAIRYYGASHTPLASAMAHRRRYPAPTPASDLAPEAAADLMRQMQDQHYRRWLDEPVPLLDGRTPREAMKSRRLKPRLVDVLKSIDNQAQRDRQAGRPAYDSRWLWKELGVAYPGS